MGNFIVEFKKGQAGSNKGLYMGPGFEAISKAINGIQRGRIFGIGAAPKVGKTTAVDYGFVIHPYLYALENNIDLEIIYFSFEIDRISKEFDFVAFFLAYDYGIKNVKLEEGQTITQLGVKKDTIPISADYLRGRLIDDNDETIKVKPKIIEKIKEVYKNRIIPMFGEYNKDGVKVSNGVINFIAEKDNPTGMKKLLLAHAEKEGTLLKSESQFNERIVAYKPNNPDKYTFVITDHIRKLYPEKGFSVKQNMDKWLEYSVELKILCNYTFIHIVHINRNMADVERMKFNKDTLYPTPEDVKDTGNLSEDCDYLFTMFNPNDDKYKLTKHFDIRIRDDKGNILFPNMRTLHLVESRHCLFPQHFRTIMEGNIKNFKRFEEF